MRCQIIGLSILHNLNQVTLLTQDIGAFELGGEYEVTLTPAAPLPKETATAPLEVMPDLPKGDTPELAKERAAENLATLPPDSAAPVPCDLCHGTGAVSVFVGEQNTGQTEPCEACKGSGVKPAQTT